MSASWSAGSITATPCYSVSSLESSEQHCKQANIIITHPPLPSIIIESGSLLFSPNNGSDVNYFGHLTSEWPSLQMKIVASIMFLWLMNGSRIIYRSEFAGGEWERPGDDMSERFLLSGHRDSRGQLQMSGNVKS